MLAPAGVLEHEVGAGLLDDQPRVVGDLGQGLPTITAVEDSASATPNALSAGATAHGRSPRRAARAAARAASASGGASSVRLWPPGPTSHTGSRVSRRSSSTTAP